MDNNKKNKAFNAAYMLIITGVVFIALVAANIIIDKMTTSVDISVFDVYSLTDTTKDILKDLDKEVTIYIVADGKSNESSTITSVVEQYEKECDNIKVERISPTLNPNFLPDHGVNLSMGSLVVECGDKSKGLEATDLITQLIDSDGSESEGRYILDVEGQLTSAIAYVISDKVPKAYILSGNSKGVISQDYADDIMKQNIDLEELNLNEKKAIPKDADIIILITEGEDITEVEYEELRKFSENGGSLFVATYYNNNSTEDFEYFNELMAHYGVSVPGYMVIENDSENYYESDKPYIIKPNYEDHKITDSLVENKQSIKLMSPDRIVIGDKPDTVSIKSILTTSAKAYGKKRTDKITQKLDTDPTGPFDIAVAITDKISDEKESRVVLVSSSAIFNDTYNEEVVGGNSAFVVDSMQWLAKQEKDISIPDKLMQLANLVITLKGARTLFYVVVVIIPATILIYGGYVWFRRRRR